MDSNRKFNLIKGISGVLVIAFAIGLYFGFTSGSLGDKFLLILVAVLGGIVLLVLTGVLFRPWQRIQKLSRSHEFGNKFNNGEKS